MASLLFLFLLPFQHGTFKMSRFFVDTIHPANEAMLTLLQAQPDQAPSEALRVYFERAVAPLSEDVPQGRGAYQGWPVFVEPRSGVVVVALCGDHAVGLRFTDARRRRQALEAGLEPFLRVDEQAHNFGVNWTFAHVPLPEHDKKTWFQLQNGLKRTLWFFQERHREQAYKTAIHMAQRMGTDAREWPYDPALPDNAALLNFLQTTFPDEVPAMAEPGGNANRALRKLLPDLPEWFWYHLPRQAGIERSAHWVLYGRLIHVHPDSGLIYALVMNGLHLRLPGHRVGMVSPLGEHWRAFPTGDDFGVLAHLLREAYVLASA